MDDPPLLRRAGVEFLLQSAAIFIGIPAPTLSEDISLTVAGVLYVEAGCLRQELDRYGPIRAFELEWNESYLRWTHDGVRIHVDDSATLVEFFPSGDNPVVQLVLPGSTALVYQDILREVLTANHKHNLEFYYKLKEWFGLLYRFSGRSFDNLFARIENQANADKNLLEGGRHDRPYQT